VVHRPFSGLSGRVTGWAVEWVVQRVVQWVVGGLGGGVVKCSYELPKPERLFA